MRSTTASAGLAGMSQGARASRRTDLLRSAEAAPDIETTLTAIRDGVREFVPFDGSCLFSTDPATMFATWPARIENIEPGHCTTYWEREFLVPDTLLWVDLNRGAGPAASLHAATDGLLERSARYREFMRPQSYGDELRATLRSGPSTWGLLELLRYEDEEPFTADEVDFVSELSRPLAEIIRTKMIQDTTRAIPGSTGPGLLMFDTDGTLISLNDAAREWAALLPHSDLTEQMPVAVFTVLAHARAVARGHQRGSARVRAMSNNGQWLLIYATCMTGVDGSFGQTAVVIEPASRSDIMPMIVEAYQLSPREQQVVAALARGASTAEMAASLYLSQHTVRDHIKAIFAKVGVASRGELMALLFAEHFEPSLHEHVTHV